MGFINEILEGKTFCGYFSESELQNVWQSFVKEYPFYKNLPVNKKKSILGKWCSKQLQARKVTRIQAPDNFVIKCRLREKTLSDNQIFFLKRRLSDWMNDCGSVQELVADLVDEHNDAAIVPDSDNYIKDVAKIYKFFGIDIFDTSLYN